jgi:hypothetical protein
MFTLFISKLENHFEKFSQHLDMKKINELNLKGKKIDGHPQHFSKKILKNIL